MGEQKPEKVKKHICTGLLAHVDAGKTTLSEAYLYLSGCIGKAGGFGMAEILGAARIRIGVFRDWHRSVVRQAAYGEVSAHFPATLLQRHPDAAIYLNRNASEQPF